MTPDKTYCNIIAMLMEEIRSIKEIQWKAVYFTFLGYAGLVYLFDHNIDDKCVLRSAVLIVLIVGTVFSTRFLQDCKNKIDENRDRKKEALAQICDRNIRRILKVHSPDNKTAEKLVWVIWIGFSLILIKFVIE